jgi:hypothetical protein
MLNRIKYWVVNLINAFTEGADQELEEAIADRRAIIMEHAEPWVLKRLDEAADEDVLVFIEGQLILVDSRNQGKVHPLFETDPFSAAVISKVWGLSLDMTREDIEKYHQERS